MRMKKLTTQTGKTVYFSDGLVMELLNDAFKHSEGIESVNVIETEPVTFSLKYISCSRVVWAIPNFHSVESALTALKTMIESLIIRDDEYFSLETMEKIPRVLVEYSNGEGIRYTGSWKEFY